MKGEPDDGSKAPCGAAAVVPDALVVAVARNGSSGGAVPTGLAHQPPGVLHRAVSIQVVDPDGDWLLQRRAGSKALFANRWANTCCTHPMPEEDLLGAAVRRIGEELGLNVTNAISAGVFTYRAVDPQTGLVEHERDHVFLAVVDTGTAVANPNEISELAKLSFAEALRLVASDTGTPWSRDVLQLAFDALHRR